MQEKTTITKNGEVYRIDGVRDGYGGGDVKNYVEGTYGELKRKFAETNNIRSRCPEPSKFAAALQEIAQERGDIHFAKVMEQYQNIGQYASFNNYASLRKAMSAEDKKCLKEALDMATDETGLPFRSLVEKVDKDVEKIAKAESKAFMKSFAKSMKQMGQEAKKNASDKGR